jgi:hypothetical protein
MIRAKGLAVGPRKIVKECTGQADFENDCTSLEWKSCHHRIQCQDIEIERNVEGFRISLFDNVVGQMVTLHQASQGLINVDHASWTRTNLSQTRVLMLR